VLHLADRPGSRPDDPAGTVQLNAVARRKKTSSLRRQSFYLTRAARVLLWLNSELGLLLVLGVGYSASYYLGHGAAEITA
jgi:hypothetical protein